MNSTPSVNQQPSPAPIYQDVLELVGNTPMLEINRIDTGPCRLLLKLESQNPGNSIKDRIAIAMIDAAEADGTLKAGGSIVEATAGNTGIALALVGTLRGYNVTVVVPDKMAAAKIAHLRALGAEVVRECTLPDHHRYRAPDLARLAETGDDGLDGWVTTEKDALKILPEWLPLGVSLEILRVELEFEDEAGLVDAIEARLRGSSRLR